MKAGAFAFSSRSFFKVGFLPVICSLFCLFPSCNNSGDTAKNLSDLKVFVEQHKDSVDKCTKDRWVLLDSLYIDKKVKLEKVYDKMDDSMKAVYDKTNKDWAAIKETVVKKVIAKTDSGAAPKAMVTPPDTLIAPLVLKGIKPDFSNLQAPQAADEYQHFVDAVKQREEVYTPDEWTAVNMCWRDLKARRKTIGKEIPDADNKKIWKLRVEYTGIKVANRPTADKEFEGDEQPML